MLFIIHYQSYCRTLYHFDLEILESNFTYFIVELFELMVGITHFGCIGHILSSH